MERVGETAKVGPNGLTSGYTDPLLVVEIGEFSWFSLLDH